MKNLDFILVHGHVLKIDGTLDGEILVPRLDHALGLYRLGVAENIIVAGKHASSAKYGAESDEGFVKTTGITEARRMKGYLEAKGVPWETIFEESEGTNTWDCTWNAYQNIIIPKGWSSGHIVSSREHLARVAWMTNLIFDREMKIIFSGPSIKDETLRLKILNQERDSLTYSLNRFLEETT